MRWARMIARADRRVGTEPAARARWLLRFVSTGDAELQARSAKRVVYLEEEALAFLYVPVVARRPVSPATVLDLRRRSPLREDPFEMDVGRRWLPSLHRAACSMVQDIEKHGAAEVRVTVHASLSFDGADLYATSGWRKFLELRLFDLLVRLPGRIKRCGDPRCKFGRPLFVANSPRKRYCSAHCRVRHGVEQHRARRGRNTKREYLEARRRREGWKSREA